MTRLVWVLHGLKQRLSRDVAQIIIISWGFHTRAASWENLFMPYGNNKGADQPVHSHSLISTFAVHCLGSIIPILAIGKISRLYLISVAEQASLSLTGSDTLKTGFLGMGLIYNQHNRPHNAFWNFCVRIEKSKEQFPRFLSHQRHLQNLVFSKLKRSAVY